MRKSLTSLTCILFSTTRTFYHLKIGFFSIALLLITLGTLAQGKRVSGVIKDNSGNPVPDASVTVKGTTTGVSTNQTGAFEIEVPNGRATLVISSVGFQAQEVSLNDRNSIDLTLTAASNQLDAVVVVGYGTQKKVTVTGAVTQVKGADLQKSPTVNLSNSLAGRLPGVFARQSSGEPGYDGSAIQIRGTNTTGNNSALIVIDGVPSLSGGFDRLNPADIDNISILKDASAAIYGARAANGVILITTKRGKTGKPTLSYDFNQGWSQPTRIPKLADATQFAELRNELDLWNIPAAEWTAGWAAFKSTGSYLRVNNTTANATYKPVDFQKFADGSDPWGHPNTDWFGATFKTWAPQSRHTVQLTGGSENVKYLASLGYENQDAYYKNAATGFKQYSMRINMDAKVNNYINVQLGVNARQENRFFPTVAAGDIFRMLARGVPTAPAYWPNGKPAPDIENGQQPVVITTNLTGYDRDTRYYFQPNGKVEITNPWIDGLKLTGTASLDKSMRRTKRWQIPWFVYSWDKTSYEADGVTPKLSAAKRGPSEPNLNMGDEDNLGVVLGALLSYDKKFGNHTVGFLAGTNKETQEGNSLTAFRRYFISEAIDQLFAGGDKEKNNGSSAYQRARLNYFGRLAYNYKEKYMAEFIWRYDGSYIFPENSRWGFFPGIMAAYRISEESFWRDNVAFVDNLKIRGSWGQLGNDQVAEYQYLASYPLDRTYVIGDQLARTLYEPVVPNPTITWEVANNADIGLEGTMLNSKVFFEFDVFRNIRDKMLLSRFGAVPWSTGMSIPNENIGKALNRGFEFKVGYNGNVGDLRFSASVNGGWAKNKLLEFSESPGQPEWQKAVGHPIRTSNQYVYDGVFKDAKDIAANTLNYSALVTNLRPGDMKFKDINGDNKITADDQKRIDKNDFPTFQGGVNMNASYRNFDLSVLFQGAAGAVLRLDPAEWGSIGNYLDYTYNNRWSVDNPSSVHPRIADRANTYYSNNNTYWIRNSNYLRLKNLEIGYSLPSAIGKKAGISNFRVYANGLNLITFDKLKVYDPESTNGRGTYYPQARILNLGFTVTF